MGRADEDLVARACAIAAERGELHQRCDSRWHARARFGGDDAPIAHGLRAWIGIRIALGIADGEDRIAFRTEVHALVHRRQETRSPQRRPA